MSYFKSLIAYGRLCSKIWEALPRFTSSAASPTHCIPESSIDELNHEIQTWLASLTPATFTSHPHTPSPQALENVGTLTRLRGNHLSLLINRQHVLSISAISMNPHRAQLVVDTARESTRSIIGLSRQGNMYARHQAAYNQFLVSALGIMLLAVSHAPGLFAGVCREEFSAAIELVRGFSETSVAGRRLWRSMCGIVKTVGRLGLVVDGEEEGQAGEVGMPDQVVGHGKMSGPGQGLVLGELFDPEIYSVQAQPDTTLMGTDLMGLFDVFGGGQGFPAVGGESVVGDDIDALFATGGGMEVGEGVDEISSFFIGLVWG